MSSDGIFGSLYAEIDAGQQMAGREYNPVIGTVTANQDPERLGRIKVKYEALTCGGEPDESDWVPMSPPGGGKDRGWWLLPELRDEVLVVFVDGCVDKPVVLGALWNGVNTPSETNQGSNERRVLVSRAGSRIVLDDDNGTITVEDGSGIGSIVVSADNRITIKAKTGDVCIQAPKGELNIVANKITMDGETAHIHGGDGGVRIGAGASATFTTTILGGEAPNVSLNSGSSKMARSTSVATVKIPDTLG